MTDVETIIGRVHQEEWARLVATLDGRFGDLDLAIERCYRGEDGLWSERYKDPRRGRRLV
jgi:hypothetical protein